MDSRTERSLPLRPETSSSTTKCPHGVSENASEYVESLQSAQLSTQKDISILGVSARSSYPPSPQSKEKRMQLQALPKPAFEPFPNPTFSLLQDAEIEDTTLPFAETGQKLTPKDLQQAPKLTLLDQGQNNATLVDESNEEENADRDWVNLCTLKELDAEIKGLTRARDVVNVPGQSDELCDGSYELVPETVEVDAEAKKESPSPKKGILRSRSNSEDSVGKKKKSVRFVKEKVKYEEQKGQLWDEREVMDNERVVKKNSVRFELGEEERKGPSKLKKTVRFLNFQDAKISGRQSRTSYCDEDEGESQFGDEENNKTGKDESAD